MRSVNGFFLFELGFIWQLVQMKPGFSEYYPALIGNSLYILRSFVEDEYNKKDLPDSVTTANNIILNLEKLLHQQELNITPEITGNLFSYIMHLRAMLMSELGKVHTTVIEDKRGFGVRALWNNSQSLFASDISPYLSEFVKINIDEAAKCLLLDRYTAVGFHAMRSVECVVRKYYELITGNSPPYKDKNRKDIFKTFGGIAQELMDKYFSMKSQKKLSGNLSIIAPIIQALCKTYRDPLSHPEIDTLTEDQSITTFNYTILAISEIVSDANSEGSHLARKLNSGELF
ncbi:MAG: hypothetical protein P8168_10385 [Deltaproteobacteria bacterium]|jgi:hypothetical protein